MTLAVYSGMTATSGALIHDSGLHGILEIAFSRRLSARVNQACAAHEAIDDLILREIDRIGERKSEEGQKTSGQVQLLADNN